MKKLRLFFVFLLIFTLLTPISTFAADKPSTTFTFYFRNIITTSGKHIDELNLGTAKISEGTSGSKAEKWFNNKMQGGLYYTGTYQGVEYNFNGSYLDENDSQVSFPLSLEYGAEKTEFYLYPQYDKTPVCFLDFKYTDNISTGSGSWKNEDGFTGYTHTFETPAPKEGYEFIQWENFETGDTYTEGQQYICTLEELSEGETKEVNVYAVWQPSIVVNWYVEGELLNSFESFNEDISAYTVIPEAEENVKFVGWENEEGTLVPEDTTYSLPEQTIESVNPNIINLYACLEDIEPEPVDGGTTPVPDSDPDPDPDPDPKPDPEPDPEPIVDEDPIVEPTPTPTPEPEKPLITPEKIKVAEARPKQEITPIPKRTKPVAAPLTQPEKKSTIIVASDVEEIPLTTEPESKTVTTIVEEPPVPTTGIKKMPHWALLNLILTILTVLETLGLIIITFILYKKEEQKETEETETEDTTIKKYRSILKRLISIIISVITVIIFFLTEDIFLPMKLVDRFTILMLIIFILHTLYLIIWRRKEKEEEQEI